MDDRVIGGIFALSGTIVGWGLSFLSDRHKRLVAFRGETDAMLARISLISDDGLKFHDSIREQFVVSCARVKSDVWTDGRRDRFQRAYLGFYRAGDEYRAERHTYIESYNPGPPNQKPKPLKDRMIDAIYEMQDCCRWLS